MRSQPGPVTDVASRMITRKDVRARHPESTSPTEQLTDLAQTPGIVGKAAQAKGVGKALGQLRDQRVPLARRIVND